MKNLLTLMFLIAFTQITFATSDDFIITIKSDNYGVSNLNQFTIPTNPNEVYDYAVDCDNDGIVEASGLTGAYTCDYAQAGIYTIRIIHDALTGDGFPAVSFEPPQIGDITDSYKLLTLDQWGTSQWINMSYAFYDARNFVITATDSPDFSMTTSMKSMFQNAVKATPNTQNWDVSSVTDMSRMFFNATMANPSVVTWIVSSVTDMDFMFARGDNSPEMSAQPDVVNWDVSSVTKMNGTFAHIKNIGDLSLWDVANVTGMLNLFSHASFDNHYSLNWNTSSVATMFGMFYNSINTPDLVNWDVSAVTNMSYMFYNCKNFEIVGKWDVALVSDMKYMFELATDIVVDTSQWNLDSLQYMEKMFANSFAISFDLTSWQLPSIKRMNDAFLNAHIPLGQYESFLINLYQFNSIHSVYFNAGFSQYCSASASNARTGLVDRGWRITDLGQYCSSINPDDFVITIKGSSFTIFTDSNLTGYNYDVDCDNDGVVEATSVQTDYTCNYGYNGVHTIAIKHDNMTGLGAPAFLFGSAASNAQKIKLLNNWGTSHWLSLKYMFYRAEDMYVTSIDQPNVSEVTNLNSLFWGANHAQMDVSSWDTSLITNMGGAFSSLGFRELDVSAWNTSLVTNMSELFATPNLKSLDVSQWDTSSLEDYMIDTFKGLKIDTLDLSQWDTSSVTVLWGAFSNTLINNLNISSLDTSAVSHFEYTFAEIEANQLDLSSWDITASPNPFMDYMFNKSTIDTLNLSNWSIKNIFAYDILAESNIVTLIVDNWTFEPNSNIDYLFKDANIQNLDLSQWDTSNIVSMRNTFKNFSNSNFDLSQWNTASLVNMTSLFEGADIANLNVINWNTSQVTTMASLFKDYKGVVPTLSNWDFSAVTDMTDMLLNAKMLTANYDAMLVKIVQDIPQSNVVFNAGNSHFCTQAAIDARAILISTYNWTIQDADRDCRTSSDFIITVKTDNMGSSTDTQFTLPINPSLAGYSYSMDCENDGIYEIESSNASYTCNYAIAGTYTVRITHDEVSQLGFPAVFFNNSGDTLKLISIEQWGEGIWADMTGAFFGASNLVINTEDMPNLSQVNDMADMFNGVTLATQTYENLLVYLKENLVVTNLNFHAGNSLYCSLEAYQAKTVLQNELNWAVSDGGYGCYQPANSSDLVFSVFLHENQLVISENAGTNNSGFDYNIDCDNDGIIEAYNVHGTYTCLYPNGSYTSKTVRIELNLPNGDGLPYLELYDFFSSNAYNPIYVLHQWGGVKWQYFARFFASTKGLRILDLISPNLSQVNSLNNLFENSQNVIADLSQWDVSSVTNMSYMFFDAHDLSLNLSGWDTSAVKNMNDMFSNSYNLSLDITGWDTSMVISMSRMFYSAHDLSLDTSGWDTSMVLSMSRMFYSAHDLSLDTSGWDTSAVTNMSNTFDRANSLSVDTSGWNTSAVTTMFGMFRDSQNLTLDTSGWNTSAVTNMSGIFDRLNGLSIDTSSWDTSSVINMSYMFRLTHDLSIDTSNWNTSAVTDMSNMFWNAHDLSIDITGWNTSAVSNMEYIYANTSNVPISLDTWDVSSLLNLNGAFNGISLPIQKYDNILINFAGQNVNSLVQFDVGDTQYCNLLAADARFILVETYNWTINDGGYCGYMFKDGFE